MSLKPSNAGIYQINALNVNQLWINGMSINDFVAAAGLEHALTDAEIVELKAIVNRIDITGLTGNWVVDDTNRNAVLKSLIDGLTTSVGTLNTKTKYITTTNGEGAIIFGGGAVSPASHIINPSATSGADWNVVKLIANSNRSYITVADDTSVLSGDGRDEIVIHNDTYVRLESSNVSLLGSLVNVGKSSNCEVAFPSLSVTQPISLTGLAWDIATGTTPSFIIAKLIAQACLPNYTDIFGFKTAIISRDKYVTTTNAITIKDYTLYNLDAVNALPVESTYIAHGNIAKNCVFGDQNYWSGSGAIELRVDDFGNIGSTTLNDKANKTNKIKVSNQNVEIRSNNGSGGNIVLHNGCVDGAIQFRKGIDGTDSVSNAAVEIISPSGAAWHLTSQVIIGADTRAGVAQTEVYQAKSKLIVDTTSFSFTGTGKVGIHGIQVSNNKAYGDNGTGVDNTYVDPANVSSKSFTLQDNYTGTTTKTLYTDANANLMYNGQQVATGSAVSSGGGLTYIITAPTTTTVTTPNFTPATDLTMSGTYTSTVNRTVTLSTYANNTNYQLVSMKGLVLASSNPVLDGTYELNQHVNYTGNLAASLYAKLYFYASTPSTSYLINKTYTSPAGTSGVSVMYGAYIPVPANDLVLVLTGVTFVKVTPNSGSANSPLVCTVVNQSGTVLYTFPTVTATNGVEADRTFTPASSPQTITVTSAITSFRFVLTNTAATTPTMSQPQAQNVNNASYRVENGSSVKMLLYDGTSNKTALTPATQAIYALSLPLPATPFVITDWITPYIQLDEWFIQPSGSTTSHTCVLQFNDGNLSHLHTSIATIPTVTTPTLAQVLVAGNTAGSTALNMNSQDITNVATLGATTINATTIVPTAITGWNVKNISGGTGISVANSSGTITISATTSSNDSEPAMLIGAAAALPSKPFWYNTIYSWLYSSSNVLTSDNYLDNCVSNTGQYQLIISSDRIRYSVDWGVTWGNTAFTSFYLNGVCITGSGNRYYLNGQYRVFYFDATYSSFGGGASYLTSFPTLSGSLTYTRMKCSQDGKYILVGGGGGYATIYQSNDYGFTSTQQNTQGALINIDDVAMSADGKYQFLMFRQTGAIAGRVMYSTNYGVSFSSPTMPSGVSYTLIRVACSATGQYLVTINQSVGILFSTDYGKNYLASSIAGTNNFIDICMSANGQFVLAITYTKVFYSEDYGRSFLTSTGTLTGATPFLQTIACSATAGYACVAGDGGRTWVIYDNPTDVRQLYAGSNVSVTPNGYGGYTIAASPSPAVEQLAFYVGTFTLSTSGNTITLPNSIDLNVYSMEIQMDGVLAQSGSSNTFFTIYYSNVFTGRQTWTNQLHADAEFAAAGDYPQSYINPVFCYVPNYPSMPSGSYQFFSTNIKVYKLPDTSDKSAIISQFQTSVGCSSSGTKITSNQAFQYQVGQIQGSVISPLPVVSSIVIGQYALSGGGTSYRSSLSGSPVQMLIYLKKRNVS